MSPHRAELAAGRWHFQHGPIDLVIGAEGDSRDVALAHAAAWQRFETLLAELVGELALLRRPVVTPPGAGAGPVDCPFAEPADCPFAGPVASRMWAACLPFRAGFITPMAAVAGAVAEEIIGCYRRPGVARAWVNNGGDIALHLTPGQRVTVGLFADLSRFDARALREGLSLDGQAEIDYDQPVRGIATSGWRGRSFSLGIADSVTVFAATASQADAAATVIANAVDVDDSRILRQPASSLKDDTDLGDLAVTVDVPALAEVQVGRALAAGLARAQALQAAGLIHACTLVCQRQVVATTGGPAASVTSATSATSTSPATPATPAFQRPSPREAVLHSRLAAVTMAPRRAIAIG